MGSEQLTLLPAPLIDPAEVPQQGSAVWSVDRRRRLRLDRTIGPGPAVLWIMLNPSVATADEDDPTIARLVRRARAAGHGRVVVCNLWSHVATDPSDLPAEDGALDSGDPYIVGAASQASQIVLGWGAHGARYPRRVRAVLDLVASATDLRPMALRSGRNGHPGHPLYVPYALTPTPWLPPDTWRLPNAPRQEPLFGADLRGKGVQ